MPGGRCGLPESGPEGRYRGRFRPPPAPQAQGATRTYGHYYNRQTAMPEWKDTCNLPRTTFSMKANLQTAEPEAIERWRQMDLYGQLRSGAGGSADFSAARRTAVRQRRNPHGHGPQQGPQGSCGEVAQHGGVRRALRPRLGLPRSADRTQGRSPARPEETRDVRSPTSGANAAPMRRNTSTSCAWTSSVWAYSGSGTTPT